MTATNVAYEETETRGFLKLRGTALLLTIGTVIFLIIALALIAVAPAVLNAVPLGPLGTVLAQVVRWVILIGLIVVGLGVLYRVGPDRDPPKFRWVSVGSVVAAVLWLLGSVGLSLYVNYFGNYNKTYGALLGAEINSEAEYQTERDSTTGEPKPMGQRGAVVADTPLGQRRD
jgi:membrane protein